MPFLQRDASAQMFLCAEARRCRSDVDPLQTFDTLVAVMLRCDQPHRTTMTATERFTVEVRREKYVWGDGVFPNQRGTTTIGRDRHNVPTHCFGNTEVRKHIGERNTRPRHAFHRPRGDAMKIRDDIFESQRIEFGLADGADFVSLT